MANYQIQDLIGARNLSRSGMSLLSQVGQDEFMGLDITNFLKEYGDFVNPINQDIVPELNSQSPRIKLMI